MAPNWIEKNLEKMMSQIMVDARHQKPLPLSITLHGIAYRKFVNILKSKSSYYPDATGAFKFLNIPVYINNKLPVGTFTVERWKTGSSMLLSGRK